MPEDTAVVLDTAHEDEIPAPGVDFSEAFASDDGSVAADKETTGDDEPTDEQEEATGTEGGSEEDDKPAEGDDDKPKEGDDSEGDDKPKDEDDKEATAAEAMAARAVELREERERQEAGDKKDEKPDGDPKPDARDQEIVDLKAKLADAQKDGDVEPTVLKAADLVDPQGSIESMEDGDLKTELLEFGKEFSTARKYIGAAIQQALAGHSGGTVDMSGLPTAEAFRALEDQVLGQRMELAQERVLSALETGFELDDKEYEAIPDTRAMVASSAMREWVEKQSDEVQRLALSYDPRNIRLVMNAYMESAGISTGKKKARNLDAAKEATKKADAEARRKKKESDEIHGGSLSGKSGSTGAGDGEEDKSDFSGGFNSKD